jgi:hypothetical protein
MVYPDELKNICYLAKQEFLALKNGVKPALRFSIPQAKKPAMEALKCTFEKYGLIFLIKTYKEIHNVTPQNLDYIVYITKSKNLAGELSEAEKNGNVKKVGEILGYPECCVNFYIDIHKNLMKKGNLCCTESFLNTKSKPNFHTNNIFNFNSKISGQVEKLRTVQQLNKTDEFMDYFLISHIPCSYDCKESVKMGRDVLRILKAELPEFANEIASALKHPFLVFDDFNWVIFNGMVKNKNMIKYESVFPIKSLYPDEIFRSGNRIVVQDDEIRILMDEETIRVIKKGNEHDGMIIDFT